MALGNCQSCADRHDCDLARANVVACSHYDFDRMAEVGEAGRRLAHISTEYRPCPIVGQVCLRRIP